VTNNAELKETNKWGRHCIRSIQNVF